MKKRMMADVLWDAANKWLASGDGNRGWKVMHSCNAVLWASKHQVRPWLLHELGAPNGAGTFPDGVDEQGCRFMFLLLAMHVAEDEGIELEQA